MPIVVTSTVSTAGEGFVLNGLNLNDGSSYNLLQPLEMPPPKKRQEWVQGADADGAALVRDPLFENRQITAQIRIAPQASMDAALTLIGAISDQLEEAEKNQDGIALVWTPAGSAHSITFYVQSGEIVEGPSVNTKDWFRWKPVISIRLDCKPFGYGAEVTSAATVTNTDPVQLLTLASVTGDVPAEGRLVVTDAATQSRRHVEWGLRQRYYDVATSLLIDSDSLVTSGFAGTGTTRSGAYDPGAAGNSVIRLSSLNSVTQAVCGTGNLGHVGSYRVKVRAYILGSSVRTRLSWQDGDGPFQANDWVAPMSSGDGWNDLDLGVVNISPASLGTQKWSARIEAYTSSVGPGGAPSADSIDIDYIVLIPASEGYGKARATFTYSAGVVNAYDQFTGIAAATVLNARAATVGGTWATSGAATDFAAADAPTGSEETESRTTTADAGGRWAILGATSYTDTEVQVAYYRTTSPNPSTFWQGAIGRWTDSSNHLRASIGSVTMITSALLSVTKVVAGVSTTIASTAVSSGVNTWFSLRLVVFGSGRGFVYALDANGQILKTLEFFDSVLATGGTLATGKPGFTDFNGTGAACTRYYDNFSHSTPSAEPIVVYSGRAAEIRSDSAIRQDSTGTYYGVVPSYRGSRLLIPCAGSAGRTTQIAVKARRNDVDTGADDNIADSTTATVHYTPRYLVVPR